MPRRPFSPLPTYPLLLFGSRGSSALPGPDTVSGLALWFDHTTAKYQDTGATTPAASLNDPVALWMDGALTQDASNAGASSVLPILKPGADGINGQDALYFDGGDALFLTGLTLSSGPLTFYFVVEPDDTGDAANYFFDGQTTRLIVMHNTTTVGQLGYFDGSYHDIAAATANPQLLTFVLQASGGEVFRNGSSIGTGTYSEVGGWAAAAMMNRYTGVSSGFIGKVGAFLLYEGAHGAGDRGTVEAYLTDAFSL